tara:strand:+ start:165 stop:425 length:261 start_codon:yes stop_codon:yes gene_type:complete
MKALWVLYLIACPNCEPEVVQTYKTENCSYDCDNGKWIEVTNYDKLKDCIRERKRQERMRSGIRYWNDPARFECREKVWKKLTPKN